MLRVLPSRATQFRSFSSSGTLLAGHNKWSKIKDKKGANDRTRCSAASKARRDIFVAVRTGGGSIDPSQNTTLAVTLRRLKDSGIPRDNIDRALAAAEKSDEKAGETVTYEAMAFGSVGVMIECITDNTARTVKLLRHLLSEHDSRIAPVGFMFQRVGLVQISVNKQASDALQETLVEKALDAGALDFEESISEDGTPELEFICEPSALSQCTEAVIAAGNEQCELLKSELSYRPLEKIDPSEDVIPQMQDLMAALEDNEDVARVWTTID